jgi:hypothetical protein
VKNFRVKNFEKFQHYKDRSPPWIKLYNELLENYEFGRLPDAQKGQLISIWLLASRTDNRLPYDPVWIASKINATSPVDLDAMFAAGFISNGDTDSAEPVEQVATPAQQRAKANGFGSRHISDEVKRVVWQRDRGCCQECGSTDDIEYDHKHPVSKGGTSEEGNIQLLCRPCNRRKRVRLATPAQPLRSLEREDIEKRKEEKILSPAKTQARASDDFENLKKVYPRRKGNYGWKAAERKFNSLVKTGVDPKLILTSAARLGETLSSRVGTEFIPMPATWLNSEDFLECAAASFERDDGMIEVLDQRQLDAWDNFARAQGQPTYPRNKKGGWRFPSKWPPGHETKMLEDVEKLLGSAEGGRHH